MKGASAFKRLRQEAESKKKKVTRQVFDPSMLPSLSKIPAMNANTSDEELKEGDLSSDHHLNSEDSEETRIESTRSVKSTHKPMFGISRLKKEQ